MFLKQNTACDIILGPILDCVDGKTPVEVLTLGGITAAIYKGSTRTVITLTASGGDNNLTHVADGYWNLTLTAANLDIAGRFKITLRDDDVFLAVCEEFEVVEKTITEIAAELELLKNIAEGDEFFDVTTSPWQYVVTKKGTPATEYKRKNAYDKNGSPITSETQVIARLEEPE